jgi:hypothetical protein
MTQRDYLALAVFVLAAAAPGTAHAQALPVDCTVNVQQLGETHVSGYNALLGGEYVEPVRLRLVNPGDEACGGTLTIRNLFGAAALRSVGGATLDYIIVDQHNRSATLYDPSTNLSNAIPVVVPASGAVEIQPRLIVPGGQPGKSGYYVASLEADFRPAGSIIDQPGTLTLSVDITPSVEANFVGYGRNATLDLGELAPGVTGSIGLQIRASTDVDVEVSSRERGKLVHGDTAIPYDLSVDGAPVDLGTMRSMELGLPDSVRGRTIPVRVVVGDFSSAPAGDYRDVVTFRISAR